MLYTNQEINKRKNREIKIKNIIYVIMYCFLVIIMTYNISLIMQSLINLNKTPSFFVIKTYVIISGSMEPNINIGDMVITKSRRYNFVQKRSKRNNKQNIANYRK